MKLSTLAPIRITVDQKAWLAKEKERTGNTYAAVVRNLIQEKLNKEGKK